jgi:bifunctional DNA-binding transcriptional regulator/antitoxin component of YhaV-PrlF toxin-antitoxin module
MAEKQIFKVLLEKHENMEATGITIPFDVEEVFGGKRVPVKVWVNGVEHRSTIHRYGEKYMMAVPKRFRDAAGIKAFDTITVEMERDTEKRVIEPPPDFAGALLKNKDAQANWQKLSYTHKKEYVRAIEEAKREETRVRRIEKAVEMISAMKNDSKNQKIKDFS